MQRITNGAIGPVDLTTAQALLTIYPPPAGFALYRLEVRFSGLDVGAQIVFDEQTAHFISDTYQRSQEKTIIVREYAMPATATSVPVKVQDLAGLSTTASAVFVLDRADDFFTEQPNQLVPNGSILPILFRTSGAAVNAPVVTLSKNGSAFAAPSIASSVAAVGFGVWKFTPTATDTSTSGPLLLKAVLTTPTTTPAGVYTETQIATHFVFDDGAAEIIEGVEEGVQTELDALDLSAGFNRSGPGATEWTATITDAEDTDPIAGARVWVTSDIDGEDTVAGYLTTDDAGQCVFLLDSGGSYYLWAKHAGKMQIKGTLFTVP